MRHMDWVNINESFVGLYTRPIMTFYAYLIISPGEYYSLWLDSGQCWHTKGVYYNGLPNTSATKCPRKLKEFAEQ